MRLLKLGVVASLLAAAGLAVGCAGANLEVDSGESQLSSDAGKKDGSAVDTGAQDAHASHDAAAAHIQLLVTVDWEGRDLLEANLLAMEGFHTQFPNVKLVQFLNAAYFTKPGAVASDVRARINRALAPGDERGLHIHGWERLFQASGATFLSTPNFWGTNTLSNDCAFDCGHEVPISAYTSLELQKVVHFSLDTLEKNGFGRAKSFRAGGWVAAGTVMDAISAEGIRADHSEVPVKFLKEEIGTLPLYQWIGKIWPTASSVSQPHEITSPAGRALMEISDNGALADYVTPDEMFAVYTDVKGLALKDPSAPKVLSIGFHQETSGKYASRVEEALKRIFADAEANRIAIESVTSAAFPQK